MRAIVGLRLALRGAAGIALIIALSVLSVDSVLAQSGGARGWRDM